MAQDGTFHVTEAWTSGPAVSCYRPTFRKVPDADLAPHQQQTARPLLTRCCRRLSSPRAKR